MSTRALSLRVKAQQRVLVWAPSAQQHRPSGLTESRAAREPEGLTETRERARAACVTPRLSRCGGTGLGMRGACELPFSLRQRLVP